jgi:hypothetical protein
MAFLLSAMAERIVAAMGSCLDPDQIKQRRMLCTAK